MNNKKLYTPFVKQSLIMVKLQLMSITLGKWLIHTVQFIYKHYLDASDLHDS